MNVTNKPQNLFKNLDEPCEIPIQHHSDSRGLLSFLDLPFPINRMYTITKNIDKSERGNHAHKKLKQIMFCLHGSFELKLSNPITSKTFKMEEDGQALFIPAGYWRVMGNFRDATTVLVLASEKYDEHDYIRDYDDYIEWFSQEKK
jgi:dTDP-4-dehydrorhamnose 3,5-epimerase-like enzyme